MSKIKNLLVSQPAPAIVEKSPFFELAQKYNLTPEYIPFIRIEGVSAKEFRAQKVDILEHTAIIFTNRTTIDHFFRICEECRIEVPDTMKYLCITEAVALYLQKYIVYRKRKISFADGTFTGFMDLILKHKSEKLLLTLLEPHKPEIPQTLERLKVRFDRAVLAHTVSADLSGIDLGKYQIVVVYSPSDVKALVEKLGGADGIAVAKKLPLVATFGDGTTQKAIDSGLNVCVMAPSPEAPSMARALDLFIGEYNAGRIPPQVSPQIDRQAREMEEFVKAYHIKELRRAKAKKSSVGKTT